MTTMAHDGSLPGLRTGRCATCGRSLPSGRSHRQYCGASCRVRASRDRRQQRIQDLLTDLAALAKSLQPQTRRRGAGKTEP